MRRNRMIRSANERFFSRCVKAGCLALGVLVILAAYYKDGAAPGPAGAFRTLTTQKAASTTAELTSSKPQSKASQEPQVEFHVEKVTEGEDYEALMAQTKENVSGLLTPVQVMELTASMDGQELDLSGCQITVKVDPNSTLVDAALEGGEAVKSDLVVTVLPLGSEPVERVFTSEEMESGKPLPTMEITYTVPEGTPTMYAVAASTADTEQLNGDETINEQRVIDKDTTIDLKGHTITCGDSFAPAPNPDDPDGEPLGSSLFVVRPGATLTIMDSSKEGTGAITSDGTHGPIINVQHGGTVTIKGGTLSNNSKDRVIQADGDSTVNVEGGTITQGSSWAGGGASTIMISSASGVTVYENKATSNADNRFIAAVDIYCDGNGMVSDKVGNIKWVEWTGKKRDVPDTNDYNLIPIDPGQSEYESGFYLEATEINKDIATKGATVFIEGNTSGTGGGGIGGNGYMELGYQPPAANTLVLEKRVTGQNPDTEREFTFTVTLKNASDGDFSGVITKYYSNGKVEQVNNPGAPFEIKLKSFESVTLRELPEGTKYDIKEKSENGYETSVTATGEFLSDNNYHVSGSLGDKVGVRVIFTNKTLTYELPETGGGSNATYIFIGGALLAAVVAGALIYKKCSKKRNGCQ